MGRQAEAFEHVALVDARAVGLDDFAHGRAGHEDGLAVDAFAEEVAPRVFGVGQVDVRDVVHDFAVDHLGHVPVPAAVAGLHVEDRDFQPFGRDGGQRRVGVAEHEQGVRLFFAEAFVSAGDDVAERLAQVATDAVEVAIRRAEVEFLEEDLVERPVVVLPGVDEHVIEDFVAAPEARRQADDLRPCPQNRHQLEPSKPCLPRACRHLFGHVCSLPRRLNPWRRPHRRA